MSVIALLVDVLVAVVTVSVVYTSMGKNGKVSSLISIHNCIVLMVQ